MMVIEKDSGSSTQNCGGAHRATGAANRNGNGHSPRMVDEIVEEKSESAPLVSRRRGGGENSSDLTRIQVEPEPDSGVLSADELDRHRRQLLDEDEVNDFIKQEMMSDSSFYIILAIAGVIEGSQAMSSLALQYLLKDDLNVTPSSQSVLFGIAMMPWVVKPLWGFLSDAFPIFGYHRRSYLFGGAMFSCVMWTILAAQAQLNWSKVLVIMLGVEIGNAILSAIAKALLVEHCEGRGQRYAAFLQTYFQVFVYGSSLIFAFMGGWALTHGTKKQTIFAITAITPGIGALVALFVSERPSSGLSVSQQLTKLWEVIRYPQPNQPYALWRPMLFMILFSMGPNSGAAMFFFFTERLGFSPQFISYMNMISTLFALIGMILYYKYFSGTPHSTILRYGMLVTISFAMLPILVVTRVNIQMGIPDQIFLLSDKAIQAAVSRIAHTPLLVMGSQLCPPGIEGTLYATLMSMLNVGAMLAEHNTAFVMWLLNVRKGSYANLPYLIAICCACAVLPLLLIDTLLPPITAASGSQLRSNQTEAADAAVAAPTT